MNGIKQKWGKCKDCPSDSKDKPLMAGRCQMHYWMHRREVAKKKFVRNEIQTHDTQLAMFNAIWNSRDRVSWLSGISLNGYQDTNKWYSCFAHVLPKGVFPKMKLFDKNIILLTPKEHGLLDQGTEEQRETYKQEQSVHGRDVNWNKIFTLREELKEFYETLN